MAEVTRAKLEGPSADAMTNVTLLGLTADNNEHFSGRCDVPKPCKV